MKQLEKERQGLKRGDQKKIVREVFKWTGKYWRLSYTIPEEDKFIYDSF